MASSETKKDYGLIQPNLIRQLRSTLDQYPDDGQILKELIQNAEDAGAREVKFMYDENEYPTEKLHDKEMAKFQGPAFIAYNDAIFKEEDWTGIRMLQDSIKEKDPMKVGRFGLGFKSVLHMTDLPCVLSQDRLLMIDPHEQYFFFEKRPTSGYMWHLQEKSDRLQQAADHFKPLSGIFGVSDEMFSKDFRGTLFRFPLRRDPSELSSTVYDNDRITNLFESFKMDSHLLLLFLRNIQSVSLYRKHKGCNEAHLEYEVKITADNLDTVRSGRSEIEARCMNPQSVRPEGEKVTYLMNIEQVTHHRDGKPCQRSEHKWLVTQHLAGSAISTELRNLCKDKNLSLVPLVGAALKIEKASQDLACRAKDGQVFCFLPLPKEQRSPTGLPVHINGYFAVSQNRRHLKWPTAGQDIQSDTSVHWNQCILQELIPVVYAELLRQAAMRYGSLISAEQLYYAMPDMDETDEKWLAVHKLYDILLQQPIFYTGKKGKTHEFINNVIFDSLTDDQETRAVITSVLSDCKCNVVHVPPHVMKALNRFCSSFELLTPSTVRSHLKRHPKSYCSRPLHEQLLLLKFVLEDSELEDMIGIQLLPCADGKMVSFQTSGDIIYVPTTEISRRLFPTMEHCLLAEDLDKKTLKMLEQMADRGLAQLKNIERGSAERLIRQVLPKEWQKQQVIELDGEKCPLPIHWFEKLWEYLRISYPDDISPFVGLHIIPMNKSIPLKLLPLSASCPIILGSGYGYKLDTRLSNLLQIVGVHVISGLPQFVLDHSLVLNNNFIKLPTGNHLINVICDCIQNVKDKNQIIRKIHKALRPEERSAFVNIIRETTNTITNEKREILRKLPVFPLIQIESNFVPADSVVGGAYLTDDFPCKVSKTLINLSQREYREAAQLLHVQCLEQRDVLLIVLRDIKQYQYNPPTVQTIMDYILRNFHQFVADYELIHLMQDIPFVSCGEFHPKKPNQLYDPADVHMSNLFSNKCGMFPTDKYSKYPVIEHLRNIGLKSLQSFTASDVLKIMREMDKHPTRPDSVQKGGPLLEILNIKPSLLRETIGRQALFEHASELYWVPTLHQKPAGYPRNLRWKGDKNKGTVKPMDVKPIEQRSLVGSVCFIIDGKNDKIRSVFSWDEPPKTKDIIEHLKNVTDAYLSDEKANYLALLNDIYSSLMSKDATEVMEEMRRHGLDKWVWCGDGFTTITCTVVEEPHLNLAPHVYTLPSEMKIFQTLFTSCGMKQKCSVDTLIIVLEQIGRSTAINTSHRRRNLQQAVEILNDIKYQIDSLSEEKKGSLLVPINADPSRLFDMAYLKDCCYCDEDWVYQEYLFTNKTKTNLVHGDLPLDTSKRLGIPSLKSLLIATEDFAITGCGQGESLTVRIRNLLEDYSDGLAIFKEMIQNADDAGATEINFLYDERQNNKNMNTLLDAGMKDFQGPAFWVHNNAQFSEEDFVNITHLGGATKARTSEQIGRFGLGFNVVYNLTDVPSFVSQNYFVVFDPHRSYLGKSLRDQSQPGIKIDFRKTTFTPMDQFQPYRRIFGWDLNEKSYGETLFRLPLRTRQQAQLSEICKRNYDRDEMFKLYQMLTKHSDTLLLFTRHIQKLTFSHLGENAEPENIQEVFCIEKSKNCHLHSGLHPTESCTDQIENNYEDLKADIEQKQNKVDHIITRTMINNSCSTFSLGEPDHTETLHWLISEHFESERTVICGKHSTALGGVAMLLKQVATGFAPTALSSPKEALAFCFLPLPVKTSLPVHMNGSFAISYSRKHLCENIIDAKDTSQADWNKSLMRGAIVKSYKQCLDYSVQLTDATANINCFELWPSSQVREVAYHVFESFFDYETLLHIPFCILDGTLITLKNVLFFNSENLTSDIMDAVNCAFDVAKDEYYVMSSPPNVIESLLKAGHDKFVSEISYDMTRFFMEIFCPHIDQIHKKSRDTILLFALEQNNTALNECIKETACIPVGPKGKNLKLPCHLIDPRGRIAKLYTNDDERFPHKIFTDTSVVQCLQNLGMQSNELSWGDVMERADTVKAEYQKNNTAGMARIELLLKVIDYQIKSPQADNDQCNRAIEHVRSIPFLKPLQKPNGYPIKWASDDITNDLICPKDLYSPSLKEIVSNTDLIADTTHVSKDVETSFKFKERVSIQQLSCQLKAMLEVDVQTLSSVSQSGCKSLAYSLYDYMESSLKKDVDLAELILSLKNEKCILIEDMFISPEATSFENEIHCPPHIFVLPSEHRKKYGSLMKELGVKEKLRITDLVELLHTLYQKYTNKPISDERELRTTLDVLKELHQLMAAADAVCSYEDVKKKFGEIYVPNTANILYPACKLCYDDCPWIQRTDLNFVHHAIPQLEADILGVETKKTGVLKKHSRGIPFGQKESLVNSLRRILENYPSHYDVLKELIQNADDAGATELHFVRDIQTYNTKHLFSESWEPLQGPALLVYNNKPFTEKDIEGIQSLGEGSKQSDPCTTGQYGIGFSSVYHLTDVPSVLTSSEQSDQILCVFDPQCKYIPGATDDSPGMRYDRIKTLKSDFPDMFVCYHEDKFDMRHGSLFRLPLRNEQMAAKSKISFKDITLSTVFDLLKKLKSEISEVFLFLTNIQEIKISDIDDNGKMVNTYTAKISSSDEDKMKINQIAQECQTYKQKMKAGQLNLIEFPQTNWVYTLRITDMGNNNSHWCVSQTLGFQRGTNMSDEVEKLTSHDELFMLPKGGVACRLDQFQVDDNSHAHSDGKVYCTLPLDEKTGLPVHINAHFALSHENRSHVWSDNAQNSVKHSWNELLCRTVVAQSYVCVLEKFKDIVTENLTSKHQDMCFSKASQSYSWHKISDYLSLFPCLPDAEQWHVLVKGVYECLVAQKSPIFPVIIDDAETRSVQWSSAVGLNNRDTFFYPVEGYTKWPCPTCFSEINIVKEGVSCGPCLKCFLKNCGMNIVETSVEFAQSFERSLQESINVVRPETVINFLRVQESENTKCVVGDVPQTIDKTIYQSMNVLQHVIDFCKKSDTFLKDLQRLPILITADSNIRIFDARQPVFEKQYGDMFKKQPNRFMLKNLFGDGDNRCIKKLGMDDFVKLIEVEYPILKTECRIRWDACAENCPDDRWFSRCWEFIQSHVKFTKKGELAEELPLEQFNYLGDLALIPATTEMIETTCTFLYPFCEADMVCYHKTHDEELTKLHKSLVNMGIPKLRTHYPNHSSQAIKIQEQFVTTRIEPKIVLKLLCKLFGDDKETQIHSSLSSDAEIVLQYFQNHLDNLTDEQKQTVLRLPLFETISDAHIAVYAYETRYVVPDTIPKAGLNYWTENDCVIAMLKTKESLKVLYENLGFQKVSETVLYGDVIFNKLETFEDAVREEHLYFLYKKYQKEQKESSVIELVQRMERLNLIKDANGHLQKASDLYDPENAVFCEMLNKDKFPPQFSKDEYRDKELTIFNKKEWFEFLKIIGLITKISEELFIQFAQEIACEGTKAMNGQENVIKRKSEKLVDSLFNVDVWDQHTRWTVLPQVQDIKFLVGFKAADSLQSIYRQFRETPSEHSLNMVAFRDSVPGELQNLVWTNTNMLSDEYFPTSYMYNREIKQVYQRMGVLFKPDTSKVVEQLVLLCQHISVLGKSNQIFHTKDHLIKLFDSMYDHLGTNDMRNYGYSILKNNPVVFVPARNTFVAAKMVVINLTERNEIRPYLYKLPLQFGPHADFFQGIGATYESTTYQYSEVLKTIHSKCGGRKLNPRDMDITFRAVKGFFESTHRGGAEGVTELFLPSEAGCLEYSNHLILNNSPAFYQRMASSELTFVADLRECGIEVHHITKLFEKIPRHLHPKLLSETVEEKLQDDCRTQAFDGDIASILTHRIQSIEFINAIERLLLHEANAGRNDITENNVSQISDCLKYGQVKTVTDLQTVLMVNNQIVPDSEMQKMCCLERQQHGNQWIIYIKQTDTLDFDLLIPVGRLLNGLLGGNLGMSVTYMIPILQCPEIEIKNKLDGLNVSLGRTQSTSRVSLAVRLGSPVSATQWDLQRDCSDFEVGEVVAYNDGAKIVHAKVLSDEDNGNYVIDFGRKELRVNARQMYRFSN